jgi:hypothetical protein
MLGWAGVFMCVLALLALAVSAITYAVAASHRGVRLDGSSQRLVLPANTTYGIYVDDVDNSGYTENCFAIDSRGRHVRMGDPGWSISSSDTENLDYVFDTGSGRITITCVVPGEQVVARPVPDLHSLLLGIALAGSLGVIGVSLGIAWLVKRASRTGDTWPTAVADDHEHMND